MSPSRPNSPIQSNDQSKLAGRMFVASFLMVGFVAGILGTGWGIGGRPVVEKFVTQLVMPVSLLWLGLIAMTLFCWARKARGSGMLFLLFAVVYWAATCPAISHRLTSQIEREVQSWKETDDGDFDALVVLGGGTGRNDDGRSQLNSAGDRVAWGARLYHTGRTKLLITTGDAIAPLANANADPSDETAEIWKQLGVKEESIQFLPGRNTREELMGLKEKTELWQGKRIGLVTSAFHMPRAMRLAKSLDLELIPVCCDYRTGTRPPNPLDWYPSAGAMQGIEMVMKEHLARLVGR